MNVAYHIVLLHENLKVGGGVRPLLYVSKTLRASLTYVTYTADICTRFLLAIRSI